MKWIPEIAIILLLGALAAVCTPLVKHSKAANPGVVDPQVAAGEWSIQIQTPPCDSPKNLQVIWPSQSGYPMTVECDSMPVAEK